MTLVWLTMQRCELIRNTEVGFALVKVNISVKEV